MIVKSFKIVMAEDVHAWDVLLGHTTPGDSATITYVLFDAPMTVTARGDKMIFGVCDRYQQSIRFGPTTQLLLECPS